MRKQDARILNGKVCKLTPMNIDETNIVSDFVWSDLYDEGLFTISEDGKSSAGFVGIYPIFSFYSGNTFTFDFPSHFFDGKEQEITEEIIERLTNKKIDCSDSTTLRVDVDTDKKNVYSVLIEKEETCLRLKYYWKKDTEL